MTACACVGPMLAVLLCLLCLKVSGYACLDRHVCGAPRGMHASSSTRLLTAFEKLGGSSVQQLAVQPLIC
jgi:hypothetical protein